MAQWWSTWSRIRRVKSCRFLPRLEYLVSVGNAALGRGPTGTRKSICQEGNIRSYKYQIPRCLIRSRCLTAFIHLTRLMIGLRALCLPICEWQTVLGIHDEEPRSGEKEIDRSKTLVNELRKMHGRIADCSFFFFLSFFCASCYNTARGGEGKNK